MSNYDFTTTLYGSAEGTNTYALTNPSSGAAPSFDTTINVNVPVSSDPFYGTSNAITAVDFDNMTSYLDAVTYNPQLGLLYNNSGAEYSLYSAVNMTGRGTDSNIPVVSESAVATVLTTVTPLTEVLTTVASASELLSIIHSQMLGQWTPEGNEYKAVFADGDTLTFYVNYTVPVSNAYSLNGVTSGTVTFTGSGGSNVTASLDSLSADSTNTASVTYRVIITMCAALGV